VYNTQYKYLRDTLMGFLPTSRTGWYDVPVYSVIQKEMNTLEIMLIITLYISFFYDAWLWWKKTDW